MKIHLKKRFFMHKLRRKQIQKKKYEQSSGITLDDLVGFYGTSKGRISMGLR